MNRGALNSKDETETAGRGSGWARWVILGTVCALVVGFFAQNARPGWLGMRTAHAADAYYNLLVRGFRAGQLDLKTVVPVGLARLSDPYDPVAYRAYLEPDGHPLWDLSYYHRKLYMYFGVTPALVLFWPYAALTGRYLVHKDAVVVFCATGFLASVGLLCLIWRRYFPGISLAVVAAGALALGLAEFTPIILPRAEVYEVAISCGYALTMLALVALWGACHRAQQRGRWLAVASLAYGLAIGARPTALFGALILLVPVAQAWREGRRIGVLLVAATGPITCIGLGLMLYNALRFGNPLEFGMYYQLNDVRMSTQQVWSPHYLKFNFWDYFLGPARWGARFPFVQDMKLPPMPAGRWNKEDPFGVLTNVPVVWLAMAAPLAWRGRSAGASRILRGFLAVVALAFATRALTLGFFVAASVRYEWEFCPVLVLLAVVGILGLERALAGWPAWQLAARWAWGLLLAFSLAFNLLASAICHAEYHREFARLLCERGQVNEALAHYQQASVLQPDDAAVRFNLGDFLGQKGQTDQGIRQFQEALRLRWVYAEAEYDLGIYFDQRGQDGIAIRQYQAALRLNPDHVPAHNSLGAAFCRQGRADEAIEQFRQTLRLQPDNAEARRNLDGVLAAKAPVSQPVGGATHP